MYDDETKKKLPKMCFSFQLWWIIHFQKLNLELFTDFIKQLLNCFKDI